MAIEDVIERLFVNLIAARDGKIEPPGRPEPVPPTGS